MLLNYTCKDAVSSREESFKVFRLNPNGQTKIEIAMTAYIYVAGFCQSEFISVPHKKGAKHVYNSGISPIYFLTTIIFLTKILQQLKQKKRIIKKNLYITQSSQMILLVTYRSLSHWLTQADNNIAKQTQFHFFLMRKNLDQLEQQKETHYATQWNRTPCNPNTLFVFCFISIFFFYLTA